MESEPDSPYFVSFLIFLPLVAFNSTLLVLGLLLVFLILGSALVSSSEVAFFSLSPSDIKDIQDTGDGKSERIIKLLKEPNNLLATILISNNLINIAIILVMARFLNEALPSSFFIDVGQGLHQFFPFSYFDLETCTKVLEVLVTVGLVTFILVLCR